MINISQHAFVPYTGYVLGYYNSSKQLINSNIVNLVSNRLMPLPLGINKFQVFNFPRFSTNYATLRMYDPASTRSAVDSITTMTPGELFSTTRTSQKPLDVRVVGWNQPVPVGLTLNSINFPTNDLDIQEDELI